MTPIPLQLDGETIITPILYVLAGLAFGTTAYLTGDHDTFRLRQLVKTLVVYGVAGLIVFVQGGDLSEPAVVGATALAAPIADKILNALFSPQAGGSPTSGFRFGESRGR
jgi:ABC-type glucose/galactose transport system permease subunit